MPDVTEDLLTESARDAEHLAALRALGMRSILAVPLMVRGTVSGVLALAVDRAMGFRIDEEHEVGGIDLVVHAETAYDLHATAGARSRTAGVLDVPRATSGPFASPPAPENGPRTDGEADR